MIKKVFLVLITSSLFLFFSCGSTKPQAADVTELEPSVETEEVPPKAEASRPNCPYGLVLRVEKPNGA